jgi:glycosyltransferase involved in cell wall biosynthesis
VSRDGSRGPLVTVVIPAYNRESLIGEAIESVLTQETDFPYEIIVVDDGSTDGSGEVARSYGSTVRVLEKENGGPASARNAGVLAANSPLIALLDSDDLMLPGRLARQAEFLLTHPDVVLTFGNLTMDADAGWNYLQACNLPFVRGQWLQVDEPYRRLLTEGNFIPNVTTMFRRDEFQRTMSYGPGCAPGAGSLTAVSLLRV